MIVLGLGNTWKYLEGGNSISKVKIKIFSDWSNFSKFQTIFISYTMDIQSSVIHPECGMLKFSLENRDEKHKYGKQFC